jgi:hypothetical protein
VPSSRSTAGIGDRGGGPREVLLVVGVLGDLEESSVDAHDGRHVGVAGGERVERGGSETAQVGERRGEALVGARVVGDRRERSRVVEQRGVDRLDPVRGGEGAAPCVGESRRAEELGHPGQGDEPHVHEPSGPPELAAQRQGGIRRGRHRDRCERVVALDVGDEGEQGVSGRASRPGRDGRDAHLAELGAGLPLGSCHRGGGYRPAVTGGAAHAHPARPVGTGANARSAGPCAILEPSWR